MERRFSRQRECVRQNLQARKDHPTAEMVHAQLREQNPRLGVATVYRNLAQLAEAGEALRFTVAGRDRFDADTSAHAHLCCERCGAVLDLALPEVARLAEAAQRRCGGTVARQVVLFFGECAACAELTKQEKTR